MNMNMMQALQQLKTNPQEFFRQAGMDVPAELLNDPKAMVQHLINSGKVNNQMLQMVMPMIKRMGG